MSNKIIINGHELCQTQIGATENKVSIFRNDKLDFQFNLSLQPTAKGGTLPVIILATA